MARFDAFLSYSHALDGKLAPALRKALHRFARPWYRPRELHVFHDNVNLTLDATLWGSIERALHDSRHFVLLASPESARSKWVRREIGYWRTHRTRETMFIVLTGGDIAWNDDASDFDWAATTALPDVLSGWFADEPHWLDLRAVRTGDEISMRHPQFSDAIASLTAAVTGRDKGELVGDDVRHRRARRKTITAVISVIAMLLVVATGAAWVAVANLQGAQAQTRTATARQWAAEAATLRDTQPHAALALAIEAEALAPSELTRQALLDTLAQTRFRGRMTGHQTGVAGVAFRPDGKIAASVGSDGTVAIWDLGSKLRLVELPGNTDHVSGVAFHPNGTLLAAAQKDGLRIWDVTDPANPAERHMLKAGRGVRAVAFSPDGSVLLTAGGVGADLWDVNSGFRRVAQVAHKGGVYGAGISRDGRVVATSTFDGKVTLWDTTDRSRPAARAVLDSRPTSFSNVAFSPVADLMLTERLDGVVALWNVADPAAPVRVATLTGHNHSVFEMSFSQDGTRALTASEDGTARLWDLSTPASPRALATFAGHVGPVASAALSRDGRTVLTGGNDQTIMVWATKNATPAAASRLEPGTQLAVQGFAAHLGRGVAVTVDASDSATIWDMRNDRKPVALSRIPHTVQPDPAPDSQPVFSPDGTTLVVPDGNRAVEAWSISDPRAPKRTLRVEDEKNGHIFDSSFSSDGRLLTVHGRKTTSWDLTTGREVPTSPSLTKSGTRAGDLLALRGYGTIGLWRTTPGGEDQKIIELREHKQLVEDIVFTPDARTMISAGADDAIVVWDVSAPESSRRVAKIDKHTGSLTGLALSPGGKLLASSARDGRVILWDISTPSRPIRLADLDDHRDVVNGVRFVSEDQLVTFSDDRTAIVWDIAELGRYAREPMANACALTGDGLNDREWERASPGTTRQQSCRR
jgi:WD40 repeat protein